MRLYEISNELAAILESEDGELPSEVEERLDQLRMEWQDKVDGVLAYRQGLIREAEAFELEAVRLREKADALNRKAEWLKEYVLSSMIGVGIDKTSGKFTATVAKSPPRVEFDGYEEEIPEKYRNVVPEHYSLDKKKVLEDWKIGAELPEGLKVTQGKHLKVK